MDIFKNSAEPLIHQAVLKGEYQALNQYSEDAALCETKNSLDFTALELARLLGDEQAIAILSPFERRVIKVIPKGENQMVRLDGNQFFDLFQVTYRPYLNFQNYDNFKKVIKNCPWMIKHTFLGDENREQAQRFKQELHLGLVANITIQWIDESMGYGVFANEAIPAGFFIGEFTGSVRQLFRRHPDHNEYCFHYPTRFFSWNYFMIDAQNEGNQMRFINHSDNPNLQPLCLCERNLLHIVFIAKSDIEAGSELTYDYGKDFWKKRQKMEK